MNETSSGLTDAISTDTPAAGARGQLGHPEAVRHTQRLTRQFHRVGDHAWCLVGNGLSNQTFIDAPEGIIAIDTGECVEEMRAAIAALREHTSKPIVACMYTHFHYVAGTRAIVEENGVRELPIYGHAGIEANRLRFGGEVAPASSRGLVHQFGILLPDSGADGLLHCGLGLFFRNPGHAPYTPGYLPPTHTFSEPVTLTIAGLTVECTPAPSDATDSVTLWFPELGVCVNNLLWPALFNIYATRGEEYRDPRIVLRGLDHMLSLDARALIGAHGPPISGEEVRQTIIDYRDAIQFIWDQTVRLVNRGMTLSEVTAAVHLPERFQRSYCTRQLYGLVEHHVRQIHGGLFGWFDGDESHLFPLSTTERANRMVAGFGGREPVRAQTRQAIDAGDYRWALELGSWLVRGDAAEATDRALLASALRGVAQHTPSANLRNWCLTRALDLEGTLSLDRFHVHRFSYGEVMASPPTRFIPVLRVLLDPGRSAGMDEELVWQFDTGERSGLRIRHPVAVPTHGDTATLAMTLSHATWAALLGGRTTLEKALSDDSVTTDGSVDRLRRFFACFDHPSFQGTS